MASTIENPNNGYDKDVIPDDGEMRFQTDIKTKTNII